MAQINSSLEISLDSTIDSDNGSPVNNRKRDDWYDENPTDPFVDKVMLNYLRHNWTLVGLEDVMDLCNEKREMCDKLPTNKKQIMNMFRENRDLLDIVYFVDCDKCNIAIEVNAEKANSLKCTRCEKVLKTKETNFFVSFPIQQQIEKSVKDNWSYISKFNTAGNSTSYTDIHDGKILRNVLDQYKDSPVNILSLCLNIDGANKFKSNVFSVWPVQLMQNYLPPSIRFLPDNIIVSGLYYNNVKPDCQKLLLPLVKELACLKDDNIKMEIENEDFIFKPVITDAVVDLPAKSILQHTKQFGSYDGCMICENPGELVEIKKPKTTNKKPNKKTENTESTEITKSNKFVRYVEAAEDYKLRDEYETLEKMLAVHSSTDGKAVDGIKGVSCLVGLEHFNVLFSISIEYMHTCLLGATKRLVNSFCNSKYSNRLFYITPKNKKSLNGKILAIKPTSSIVRKPRSLDQRQHFKASEFRSMLLYYLPVCLPGCVPKQYVDHIRVLSAALYTLLKSEIPNEELDNTERMMNGFVKKHQELYGKEDMVTVIHLLKHMCKCVRDLGPLWAHSAFPFERNNGCLLKTINGTTDVLYQMSTKYVLKKALTKRPDKKKTVTNDNIFLGKSVSIVEHGLVVSNVVNRKRLNLSNISLEAYKRIKLGKMIFTSVLYTRPKKSVDYFVKLVGGQIGTAKFFFKNGETKCVIIDEYEVIDNIYHIEKVQATKNKIMAPIELIKEKLIFREVGLCKYVVCPPNAYENE